jgi:hypothetical protein
VNIALSIQEHGFQFKSSEYNLGVCGLALSLQLDGQHCTGEYHKIADTEGKFSGYAQITDNLELKSILEPIKGIDAAVLRHTLTNTGKTLLVIDALCTGIGGEESALLHGKGSWLGWDLRYGHTDNVRTERYPHCQMEYPYVRMLPVEERTLGRGEDQPFPAIFIEDIKSGGMMVIGAASQTLNYLTFTLRKQAMVNKSIFDRFSINHETGHAGGFVIQPGETLALDGIYFQIIERRAYDTVYDDYLDYLSSRHCFRGATTPLLKEAFHCTWNYGVFADQTEKSLLPTARFIAKHLPGIKWFLMDAGYLDGDIGSTMMHRFYPDPNQYISAETWPRGIRGYTDELRTLGLRPGLWWSPTASIKSALYQDHPEWFLKQTNGKPYCIGEENGFLDYSHPGALDYLDRTLAVILGEWGMDACKMDFWSQNFEDREVRYYDPSMTAPQVRNRFFETVRKHLPEDGVFMTCVAVSMGNPFIGQWADTYRNTIDIGVGVWDEQKRNCCWALPTLGFTGRKSFLLNNDSVGIMPEYPGNENLFRFTWTFMNMGLVETGGRMETWPEQWVKAMRTLTDRCDRGYKVRCPDTRAFTGEPLPESLVVDYPSESPTAKSGVRQSLALFNWTDQPRVISVRRADLGHSGSVKAKNVWTGDGADFSGDFITLELAGRSAVLWDVFG